MAEASKAMEAAAKAIADPNAPPYKPTPSRALKPDAQAFDRIEIVTRPRFKESYLSGDEWRISAEVIFWRKGKDVHRETFRDVDTATRMLASAFVQACDSGLAYYAGQGDICDQEGCAEAATWHHALKQRFCNSGHASPVSDGGEFRLFCERHKHRGDCGMDDADSNYIVTPLHPASS